MADKLAEAGVVRSRWDFLLARLLHRHGVLQAGEYRFQQAASARRQWSAASAAAISSITNWSCRKARPLRYRSGRGRTRRLQGVRFLQAALNPAMIRDLDPQAPSLEGYLFPNTYRLGRHTTPERLCRIMTGKFREAWKSLQSDADVHDTVTLASLVEKEGKLAEERPHIAAVFANRLRIGMKLDCDPTTIYAALLQHRYTGVIHRSDLDSDHPYNTYRHTGLPPGPIANPGLASLRAALTPADSDSLYFVARVDGSGGHEFSSNIAAHESAVDRYRRAHRK